MIYNYKQKQKHTNNYKHTHTQTHSHKQITFTIIATHKNKHTETKQKQIFKPMNTQWQKNQKNQSHLPIHSYIFKHTELQSIKTIDKQKNTFTPTLTITHREWQRYTQEHSQIYTLIQTHLHTCLSKETNTLTDIKPAK